MNSAARTGDGPRYHHGDLHNALIIASAQLIEEKGLMDFSMVAAARRLGVSNAAPYRHFRDKNDLLNAVTDLGFYALGIEVEQTAARYETGSEECLVALGHTYLDFLRRHQPFHELMWGQLCGELSGDNDHFPTRGEGLRALVFHVGEWCRRHRVLKR
ncbi:MAG: TetR/AcrR family transcriptional regulator [Parahaliea sp.]